MGFLPIIITLTGFIGLFWLVVNQSFIAKKKAILLLQNSFFEGLEKSGRSIKKTSDLRQETLQLIEAEYQNAKSSLIPKNESIFEKEIKPIYQTLKITVSQYNKQISKKPYSFVAKGMRHKQL
jgi:hypothetical protein